MSKAKRGPSLRARLLGQELADARAEARLTMDQVAEFLQVDQSKISRMESAIYPAQKVYVLALLDLYSISDERRRQTLLQLAEDVWRKGWWDSYSKDVDRHFVDYPWLESRADVIKSFETSALSGLAQTREYATAIISRAESGRTTSGQIERLVDLRMARQQILNGDSPKNVSIVIDEGALYRPVGGPETMRAQLRHLLSLSLLQHVTIQVLPQNVGSHAVFGGPFTLFEMPDPYPDVAYAENLAGYAYIEESTDVERIHRTYDELHEAALSPTKSAKLITSIEKDIK